jgi:metal-responsive CopG/Arc/MetJ family transcriptional regulator
MRTTIELTENQRAELLRLAAKRGLKGFSHLVQEALDEYLQNESKKLGLIEAALGLKGVFKGKSSEEFEQRTLAIRSDWR